MNFEKYRFGLDLWGMFMCSLETAGLIGFVHSGTQTFVIKIVQGFPMGSWVT